MAGIVWLSGKILGSNPSAYQEVAVINNAIAINQSTEVDPANSSTVNLAVGATFAGTATYDIPYSGVQFTLKTDQNCIVYIDQSPDGINWDISDQFDYFYSKGGTGYTVMLVSSYFRIRVTNIGTATTTYFRLQTIGVPLISPLPRSLDPNGHLRVSVNKQIDDSGFSLYYSPAGEQIAVPIYRLLGRVFSDTAFDTTNWTASIGTGGSVTETGGQLIIATGTTANNATSVQSNQVGRYVAAQVNVFRSVFNLTDTGTTNNTRRWGAFNSDSGTFFELSGTTLKFVTRKATVDTAISNGSFNGAYGNTFTLDTNVHVWEIRYTSNKVYFFIDENLYHTAIFNSAPWYSNIHVPCRFENTNSGGSTTNVTFYVRSRLIFKIGIPQTQPFGYFQQGLTAGVQIKIGPGNLHGVTISGVTNNSVITLYDGTSVAGIVKWSTGPMTNNTFPFDIPFNGIAFDTGLFLTITGAASNTLIKYE